MTSPGMHISVLLCFRLTHRPLTCILAVFFSVAALFSRDTYNHLVSWLTDARTLARPDISVVVVGNKCDKKSGREVTLLEASRFAQENGICIRLNLRRSVPLFTIALLFFFNSPDLMFMETSAVTGECVDEVFLKCTQAILSKIESGMYCARRFVDHPASGTHVAVQPHRRNRSRHYDVRR